MGETIQVLRLQDFSLESIVITDPTYKSGCDDGTRTTTNLLPIVSVRHPYHPYGNQVHHRCGDLTNDRKLETKVFKRDTGVNHSPNFTSSFSLRRAQSSVRTVRLVYVAFVASVEATVGK